MGPKSARGRQPRLFQYTLPAKPVECSSPPSLGPGEIMPSGFLCLYVGVRVS